MEIDFSTAIDHGERVEEIGNSIVNTETGNRLVPTWFGKLRAHMDCKAKPF